MTEPVTNRTARRKSLLLRCEQLEERSVLSTMFLVDPMPPEFADGGSSGDDAALVDTGEGTAVDCEISILPAEGWDGTTEEWVDDGSWTDEGWVDDGWVDDTWVDDGTVIEWADDSELIFTMYVGEDGEAWCGTTEDWSEQYDYSDEMLYYTMDGELPPDDGYIRCGTDGSEVYENEVYDGEVVAFEGEPEIIMCWLGGVPLEGTPQPLPADTGDYAFAPDGVTVELTTPAANPTAPTEPEAVTDAPPVVPSAPESTDTTTTTPTTVTDPATTELGSPELTEELPVN